MNDGQPLVVGQSIFRLPVKRLRYGVWITRRVFCSLACVKRYIIDRRHVPTRLFPLLQYWALEAFGVTNLIVAAPSLDLLHSRHVTLTQYRKPGNALVDIYTPCSLPVYTQAEYICRGEPIRGTCEYDDLEVIDVPENATFAS